MLAMMRQHHGRGTRNKEEEKGLEWRQAEPESKENLVETLHVSSHSL